MITSIEAARLEALAKERYAVYGFPRDDIHVTACTHGFVLLVGTAQTVFRSTAITMEQAIPQ